MVFLSTLALQYLWHTLSTTVASAKQLGCGLLLCHFTICQLAGWTPHCFDAVKATRVAALLQAYLVERVEASQSYCGRPVSGQWLGANSTSHRWELMQTRGPEHCTDGCDTHHTHMSGRCDYLKIHTMKMIVA